MFSEANHCDLTGYKKTMPSNMEMKEVGENNLAFDGKHTPVSSNDVSVSVDSNHASKTGLPPSEEDEGFSYDPVTGDLILQKRVLKEDENSCAQAVSRFQEAIGNFYTRNKGVIWKVVGVILLALFLAYVVYSLNYRGLTTEGPIRLLVGTILGLLILVMHYTGRFLQPLYDAISKLHTSPNFARIRVYIKIILYIASTVVTVTLIIVLVAIDTPKNLVSLTGLAALILICYITSYKPSMIEWHPVFWGFSIQFYFAVIILKTRWGYEMFNWMGARVTEFLTYSNDGAKFVFGDVSSFNLKDGTTFKIQNATNLDGSASPLASILLEPKSSFVVNGVYTIHFFAFSVLPVVVFFSAFLSVLFYLGVMNVIIGKIGHFLSFCLGTTPAESLNAAGNIFVGMTESPLLIRPFIGKMTSSEIHAVMTGGFATIAGSVLGVYISFGIPADHLLSASVMSAPAALAISKITYPEVEIPIIKSQDYSKVQKSTDSNMIQAASSGAMMSGKICAAIMVNLMGFLSLLKFVNVTLTWFGDQAGVENLTFELICSYVLYPIALFMGADADDCRRVAELIGVKTFTNEFVAFGKLSTLVKNRKTFEEYTSNPNNTWHKEDDDIFLHGMGNLKLEKGILDVGVLGLFEIRKKTLCSGN